MARRFSLTQRRATAPWMRLDRSALCAALTLANPASAS
jgi:hypothetical protein